MIALMLALALQPTTNVDEARPERRVLRMAVHDIGADAGSEHLARITTDAVAAELRKLQRVSVISTDEVRALLDLEAEKQLVGCSDESCIAEIAEALGADVLIVGRIAKVGVGRVFGLKRIDARRAETTGQVAQPLDDNDEAVLAIIGPAVEQLFPELPLRDGQTRGVAKELHLRLNPPPVPLWATLSVGAAATAALVVTGAAAAANVVTYSAVQGKVADSTSALSGKELRDQEALLHTSFGVIVGAGATTVVLGAAAGVLALFTDWDGYADTE